MKEFQKKRCHVIREYLVPYMVTGVLGTCGVCAQLLAVSVYNKEHALVQIRRQSLGEMTASVTLNNSETANQEYFVQLMGIGLLGVNTRSVLFPVEKGCMYELGSAQVLLHSMGDGIARGQIQKNLPALQTLCVP